MARPFDPRHLDVAAFAKAQGVLDGEWPIGTFTRLLQSAAAQAELSPDPVTWQARGEQRVVPAEAPQTRLHLHAAAQVVFECQRCLNPVLLPIEVDRGFLFVHGEDAAAQLDADSEDDVLAFSRSLDLHGLVEDELLLAMPIVPVHQVCPVPLPVPSSVDDPANDPANAEPASPFAALAELKRKGLN